MSVIEDNCGSLVFLRKNGELGSTYPLTTGETRIGSSTDADIRFKIKDDRLEEIHCVIDVTEEGLATLLNKSELAPVSINTISVRKLKVLCNGDVIDLLGKKIRYLNEHVTKQDALKHEKGLATQAKSRQSEAHGKVHTSAKKSFNRNPARPSTPKPSFKKNLEMERPQTISKLLSLTPQPSRRNKIRRLSMDNPKRLSRSLKVSERDILLTSNVVFSTTFQRETTPSKTPTSKISEKRTGTLNLPELDKLKTPKNTPSNKSKLLAYGRIETPKPGTKVKSVTTPCTNTETPKMTPSRKSQSKIVTSALKPEKIGPRLKVTDSIQKRRKSTSAAKSLDKTPSQRRKSESNLTRDDFDRRATRNVPDRRSRQSRNLKRRITSVRTEDSSDVSLHISSVSTTSPIGSLSDLSSSESEFVEHQVAKESRKSLGRSQKMEVPSPDSLKNEIEEKPGRSSGRHLRSVKETLLLEKDASSISSEEENQEYPESTFHGSNNDSVRLKTRQSMGQKGEKLNDTSDIIKFSLKMEERQPLRRSSTSRFSKVSALNDSNDSFDLENPPALRKVEKRQSSRSSKVRSPDESSESLDIKIHPQQSEGEKRQSLRLSNVSRFSKAAALDESNNSVDLESFPGQSEVERQLLLHNSNVSRSSEALDESCDSLDVENLSGQREVEKRQTFNRSRSSKVRDLDESSESLDIENQVPQSDVEKRRSLRHSNVSRSSKVKDLNKSSDSSNLENHPEQREAERRQSLRRSKVSRSSEALDESYDSLDVASLSGRREVEKRQTLSRSSSSKVRDHNESSESLDIENQPPQSDVEKRQSLRHSNISRSSQVKGLNESSGSSNLENHPEQREVERRQSLRRSKVSRSSEALDVANLSGQREVEKRQTFSRSRSSKVRDLDKSSESLDIENQPLQSDVERRHPLRLSNVSRSKGVALNESSNSLDFANIPGQREVEERQSLRRSNVSRCSKVRALNESEDSLDLKNLSPLNKVERRPSMSHPKSSKVKDLDQSSESLNTGNHPQQSEVEKRQSSSRLRSSKVRKLNESSQSFETENFQLRSEVDKRKSLNRSNVSRSSELGTLSGSSDSSDPENLPQSDIEKQHSLSYELLELEENSSASSVDLSRSFLSSTSSIEGSRRSSPKSGRATEDSPTKLISLPRRRSSLKRTYLNESRELSIRLSKSAAQLDVSSTRRSSLRRSYVTNDVAASDNITRRVSLRRSSTTYCKSCMSPTPQRRSSTAECSNTKERKPQPVKGLATSDDDANDSEPSNASSVTKGPTSRKSSRSPLSSSWQNTTTVIVDDSIKSTPENNTSIIILDTPLDVTKRMSRQKLSKTLNSSIEDPMELTTPKSAIKGRRSKSMPYRPIVEDITPVTPQEASRKKEGGFKTPVNTPGLFENIKKSAIMSRSRRKLSSNLSEELNKAAPKGANKRPRQSGDSSQNSPKRRKVTDDGTFDEDPQNFNDSFASFGTEDLFDDSDAEEYVAPNTPRDFKNLTDKPLINDPQAKCLTEPRKRKAASKRLSLGANNLDCQSSSNDSTSYTPFSNSATDESVDPGRSSRGVPSKPQKENVAHKTPQQSSTNDRKVKKPVAKSPKNDLTDVRGLRNLMQTPRPVPSPKNDLTNIVGVKKLLSTPKVPKSPKNDLRNVPNLRRIMSPRHQNSPKNDLRDVAGLKKLFSTPRKQNEPKNDLTNVAGVKKLLGTPRTRNSPRNDLSKVPNLGKFLYPKSQNDPRNSLDDVEGVADIFTMLEAQANQSDIENNEYFVNKPQKTYRGKSLSPLARKAILYGGDDDRTVRDLPYESPRIEKWLRDQAVVNLERVDAKTSNKGQPEGAGVIGAKEDGVIRDIKTLATEPPRTVRSGRRGRQVEAIDSTSEFMESAPPLPVKRGRTRKTVQEEGKAEQIGEVDSTTEGGKPDKSKRGRGRKISSDISEGKKESKKVKKQEEIVAVLGSDEISESSVGRRALRRRIQKSDSECEQIEQPVRRGGRRKLLSDPDCQEVTKKTMVAMGGRQKKIENAEVDDVKEIPDELGDGRRKRVHFEDDVESIVNAATPEAAKKSRTKLKRDLSEQEPTARMEGSADVVAESGEAPVKKGRRGQKKEVKEDEDVQDGKEPDREAVRQVVKAAPEKRGKVGRPKKVAAEDANNLANLQEHVKKELKIKVADKAPEKRTRARTRRSPSEDGSDLEKECKQKPSPPKRTRRNAVVENEEEKDVGEEKEEVKVSKRPVRTLTRKVIEEVNREDSPRMTRQRRANFKKYGSEFTELGISSKEDNAEEASRAVGRSRRARK